MPASQRSAPAIHVRELQKSFKELDVLCGVDLDVARGSVFALVVSKGRQDHDDQDLVHVTLPRYVDAESRHVQAVASFMEEAGEDRLQLQGVEHVPDWSRGLAGFAEGDSVDGLTALDRLRLMLREALSCRLEASSLYCHVGYDYYLYVGTSVRCPKRD